LTLFRQCGLGGSEFCRDSFGWWLRQGSVRCGGPDAAVRFTWTA